MSFLIILFAYVAIGHFYAVWYTPANKEGYHVRIFYTNCFFWLPIVLARGFVKLYHLLQNTIV